MFHLHKLLTKVAKFTQINFQIKLFFPKINNL